MTSNASGAAGFLDWCVVAAGAAVAGIVDLVYAVMFVRPAGMPAIIVPQSIASGVLGMAAFRGGGTSAALGIALHFAILLVAAAIYFRAGRRLTALVARPLSSGLLYGLAFYLFMHGVVLPLSRAPHFKSAPLTMAADLLVHVILIGPIIALAAYRAWARQRAPASSSEHLKTP